jgi:hypothetical protein
MSKTNNFEILNHYFSNTNEIKILILEFSYNNENAGNINFYLNYPYGLIKWNQDAFSIMFNLYTKIDIVKTYIYELSKNYIITNKISFN